MQDFQPERTFKFKMAHQSPKLSLMKTTAASTDENLEAPVALDILEGIPPRYRAWHDFLGKRIVQVYSSYSYSLFWTYAFNIGI